MTAKNVLLIICDGLGDRPIKELNNKTPLEAADTKVLDKLAKKGACGLMYAIAPGIKAGSDRQDGPGGNKARRTALAE